MVHLDTTKLLFNTTDAELWNFSVLVSWLCAAMSKKPIIQGKYVTPSPPPSAAIREHQVQPKLFLWEQRTGSFSIQSVSSLHESLLHSTFLPEISAEIHWAVRKQLLFVKGSGWCNFNFKDVLNELPACDWWAVRNLPAAALYPALGAFNYRAPVLMHSAAVWYASCMWGEWICNTWLSALYSIIAHSVISWNCIVIKLPAYKDPLVFMYSLICLLSVRV